MKISLDDKSIYKLKGPEDYRKWKKDVIMAVTSIGASYLLTRYGEHPLTQPPPSASTNISTTTSPDEHVTLERYTRESEQLVAKLYAYMSPLYQEITYKLPTQNITVMFAKFDELLIGKDVLLALAKRRDIDSFTFKLDDTFLTQLVKFEELKIQVEELGGAVSDVEMGVTFIDAMPFKYKEKLGDIVNEKTTNNPTEFMTFTFLKGEAIKLYTKDKAWKMLPYQRDAPSSLDKALYGYEVKTTHKDKREVRAKGGEEKKEVTKEDDKGKGKGKGKDKEENKRDPTKVVCFNCQKQGHPMTQCKDPITPEGKQRLEAWLEKKRKKGGKPKGEKGKGKPERHHSSLAISARPYTEIYSPHTFLPHSSHSPPSPHNAPPLSPSFSPLFSFDGMDCSEDPEVDCNTGIPVCPTPVPENTGGELAVATEAPSRLPTLDTQIGEDPKQVGIGSGLAGGPLDVSTWGGRGNLGITYTPHTPRYFISGAPHHPIAVKFLQHVGGTYTFQFPHK